MRTTHLLWTGTAAALPRQEVLTPHRQNRAGPRSTGLRVRLVAAARVATGRSGCTRGYQRVLARPAPPPRSFPAVNGPLWSGTGHRGGRGSGRRGGHDGVWRARREVARRQCGSAESSEGVTTLVGMLIGAHVRDDDPLAAAAERGAEIVQFFLADPQGWKK